MPMYFFDLADGQTRLDVVGGFFESDEAAKQEAALRALNGAGHQLEHYNGKRAIIVRNAEGNVIHEVKIQHS